MAKRYDEEVAVDYDGGIPASFVWRERRYVVTDVIGKWRIEGRWWDDGRGREHRADPAGGHGHRGDVPSSVHPRDRGGHRGPHVERTPRARDRGGVVRGGTPRARHPVPSGGRSRGDARGGGPGRSAADDRGSSDVPWEALCVARGDLSPAAGAAAPPTDLDRSGGGEA